MFERMTNFFSFSTLAMVAVAAMLMFGSANKVQADETAKQVVDAGLHGADQVFGTITKQHLAYTMVGFIVRGFNHMQEFLPKKLYCPPKVFLNLLNMPSLSSASIVGKLSPNSSSRDF